MENRQSKILSGAQLVDNKRQAGKSISKKESKVSPENSSLENFYQKHNDTLQEERVQKLGELSTAIYNDEDQTIELIIHKGKFWHTMGYNKSERKYIYFEEALFLMEAGLLEISHKNIPLSIQEAHSIFLNTQDCSLEEYLTFSHLTRLGYVVIKHRKAMLDQATVLKQIAGENLGTSSNDYSEDTSMSEASTSNEIRDFSNIDFPNCAAKWKFQLPVPSSDLLPPNIMVTEDMCSVNLYAIQNNSCLNSKKYNRCKREYFKKQYDEEYPKIFDCKNTQSRCWTEFKKEMKDYKMTSLKNSSFCVKLHTIVKNPIQNSSLPKISYDVYLPTEKFSKNGSMLPNHRLVVVGVKNSVPSLNQLISLQTQFNDSVPIHYSVVCDGEVSFFTLSCADIPNLK